MDNVSLVEGVSSQPGTVGGWCHDVRMRTSEQLEAEATALGEVPCRPAVLDDRRLLEEIEAWERIGRLADARRTALAGEIAWRSREQIGEASLAKREGQRDAVDLLAHELRISTREAKRRTALGLRLRSRLSLLGEELPARWAHVAAALEAGRDRGRRGPRHRRRTRRGRSPRGCGGAAGR